MWRKDWAWLCRSNHEKTTEVMAVRTRLSSERMIKHHFPHIVYVRVHTYAHNKATVYAWNEDMQLTEQEIARLKRFAYEYVDPQICFDIKAYHLLKTDQIPPLHELPDSLVKAATETNPDPGTIAALIGRLFPYGGLSFNRYNEAKGIIHFDFYTTARVTEADKDRLLGYLQEMIPIGLRCGVAFH